MHFRFKLLSKRDQGWRLLVISYFQLHRIIVSCGFTVATYPFLFSQRVWTLGNRIAFSDVVNSNGLLQTCEVETLLLALQVSGQPEKEFVTMRMLTEQW